MNNEELRGRRDWLRKIDPVAVPNGDLWIALGELDGSYRHMKLCALVELAQRAVLPGDAEPTAGGVTYGEWTTVDQLPYGALFEIQDDGRCGVVINAEHTDGLVECVPVMPCRNRFVNLLLETKVRQIHLPPAPVAPPQEPTLEERAWQFIEKMRDYNGWNEAEELLAERAATQGTAGG